MAESEETKDEYLSRPEQPPQKTEDPNPRTLDTIIKEIYNGISNVAGTVSPTLKKTLDEAAGMTLSILIGYYSGWLVDQARNTLIGKYIGLDAGIQSMHEISGGRIEATSYVIIGAGIGIAAYATTAISKAWHKQENREII